MNTIAAIFTIIGISSAFAGMFILFFKLGTKPVEELSILSQNDNL